MKATDQLLSPSIVHVTFILHCKTSLTHLPIFSVQHVVRHEATKVKHVNVVLYRHLKVG